MSFFSDSYNLHVSSEMHHLEKDNILFMYLIVVCLSVTNFTFLWYVAY